MESVEHRVNQKTNKSHVSMFILIFYRNLPSNQ